MLSDKVVFPLWELPHDSDPYEDRGTVKAFYKGEYRLVGRHNTEEFMIDRVRRTLMNEDLVPLNKGYTDLGSLLLSNPAPSRVFIDASGNIFRHKDKSTFYSITYFFVKESWRKGSFQFVRTPIGTHKVMCLEDITEVGYIKKGNTMLPCNYLMKGWTKKKRKRIKL